MKTLVLEDFDIEEESDMIQSVEVTVEFENTITDVLESSNVSLLYLGICWANLEIDELLWRNKNFVPVAVRHAALLLIGIRQSNSADGMGAFAVCPKDVVKLIAMQVWATRTDPIWIESLPGYKNSLSADQTDELDEVRAEWARMTE